MSDSAELRALASLADLVDAYAEADAAVKATEDRRKDLRDQLLLAYADAPEGTLQGPFQGTRAVVTVSQTSSWRIDSTRLKTEQPAIYAAFAKQSHSTRLTVVPR